MENIDVVNVWIQYTDEALTAMWLVVLAAGDRNVAISEGDCHR
ncbi:hypothetical protein P0D69_15400 [Paraburkholderia sediminicola]